jgi:phytanoyl-CoA hydroxylase
MTLEDVDGANWQERYWQDGFVLLEGLFAPDALARFDARTIELASGQADLPPNMTVMRDVMVARGAVQPETPLHAVNKLLSFEQDPVLFEHSVYPRLLEAARGLVGPSLMTISTNVFNKPPGIDGRHPLHQDLRYFTLRPADGIVAAWTAISRCARENGCLAVIPKSHRTSLRRHEMPGWEWENNGFLAAADAPLEERVHVEMEPGDTLLFHPLLLHGSGRNRSRGFRRAISTHYAARTCHRPPGARKRDPVTRDIPDA